MRMERIYRFARGLALICAVAVFAAPLGGCAAWQKFQDDVTTFQSVVANASTDGVPIQTFAVVDSSFDGVKRLVTNYYRLPICDGTRVACVDPTGVPEIDKWMQEATTDRNAMKKFFRENPGKLGPSGTFAALKLAVSTLQSLAAKYNMGAPS